ncbi:MAG: alpha-isopropylmalate synthase regulatory domain-containing protein [Kofleriaceae bacterium]
MPEHDPLIRRVLGANYLELGLVRLIVDEVPDQSVGVKLTVNERGSAVEVEGSGVGLVDAIFSAMLGRHGREVQSLHSIQVVEFSVVAELDTKSAKSGLDAVARVTIDAVNSEGRRFTFRHSSRSLTSSTARAVLEMVQYFLNAERAFVTLDHARRDAIERGREDLVSRYTAEMAEVVESTSYAEVIEAIRKGLPR